MRDKDERASGFGLRASGFGLLIRRLLAAGLCWLCFGCSVDSGDNPNATADSLVREALTQRIRDDVSDDIGLKIAGDQSIRHDFHLKNPTDTPIRLVGALARKTCCSSIGPTPKVVTAHGEALVPVTWRIGHQSGRTRVQFVVSTDRLECRTIDLSLTATLVPAWEASQLESPHDTLEATPPSSRFYQVVTRQLDRDGLSPPTAVDSAYPFRARFVGDTTEQACGSGLVESRRVVEISLAPGQSVGCHAGELKLTWQDGTEKTYPIRHEIPPHLRAIPSTLVVSASDVERKYKVAVNSDGRPFRVLKVAGRGLAKPGTLSTDPALTHLINLELDLSYLENHEAPVIALTTDHPDQTSLNIKILLVPSVSGGTP